MPLSGVFYSSKIHLLLHNNLIGLPGTKEIWPHQPFFDRTPRTGNKTETHMRNRPNKEITSQIPLPPPSLPHNRIAASNVKHTFSQRLRNPATPGLLCPGEIGFRRLLPSSRAIRQKPMDITPAALAEKVGVVSWRADRD